MGYNRVQFQHSNLKLDIDKKAKWILDTLNANSETAYAVGGCIRDLTMGKLLNKQIKQNDTDICTQATPETVIKLFRSKGLSVIKTGIQHGTVSVVIGDRQFEYLLSNRKPSESLRKSDENKEVYEITTYRVDGKYSDGRHPDSVKFTTSVEDDLERRDFTINAMAYYNGKLVGTQTSIADIENKLIRCVGNPTERLSEDPLRILRAFRFQATMGFKIEQNTLDAMIAQRESLSIIQKERIHTEIVKAFGGRYVVQAINDCRDILNFVIKQLEPMVGLDQKNKHHKYNLYDHTVKAIESVVNSYGSKEKVDYIVTLAALLHDIGKPETMQFSTKDNQMHFNGHARLSADMAVEILKSLRFSKQEVQDIQQLVEYHDTMVDTKASCKRLLNKIGEQQYRRLLILRQADVDAQQNHMRSEKCAQIVRMMLYLDEILKDNQALTTRDLKINGKDLMEMGMKPGKDMGNLINEILTEVIEERLSNNREELIKYAQSRIK